MPKYAIKAVVIEHPLEFTIEAENMQEAVKEGHKQARRVFSENTIIESAIEVKKE